MRADLPKMSNYCSCDNCKHEIIKGNGHVLVNTKCMINHRHQDNKIRIEPMMHSSRRKIIPDGHNEIRTENIPTVLENTINVVV